MDMQDLGAGGMVPHTLPAPGTVHPGLPAETELHHLYPARQEQPGQIQHQRLEAAQYGAGLQLPMSEGCGFFLFPSCSRP